MCRGFSVIIIVIFVFGCQPVQDVKRSEVTMSSLEQKMLWKMMLNGKDDYDFYQRHYPKTTHFTQITALPAYLGDTLERGNGIIIVSKIYQTLPKDEIRRDIRQLIQLLEQRHYVVLGIQINSSTRANERIYQFDELPF